MSPSEAEFRLEEYKQIRAEVTEMITKTESLMKYAVVVAAAVFSWLATQGLGQQPVGGEMCSKLPIGNPLTVYAWWIPCAAVIVVGLLEICRLLRVKEMGAYLMALQNELGNKNLGWEKYLRKQRATIEIVTALAWVVMLLGTAYIAYLMQVTVPNLVPCAGAKP